MNYSNLCFVIMPFGKKQLTDNEIDFDFIYSSIIEPAIKATSLPEGGFLVPRRTDKDFFSGEITNEMFLYLEYSRFALADITGLNANVFYELGVRHRARISGTAIFRLANHALPFDISHIKAFPYEYQPEENAREAKTLITRVLTESLVENRLDSPVQLALAAQKELARQQHTGELERLLREAENAIRHFDTGAAVQKYQCVLDLSPDSANVRVQLGLLLKEKGEWKEALEQFSNAVLISPLYADAYREKGIAENKLFWKEKNPLLPTGEKSLRQAIKINPKDFDALSSLGGILKRDDRLQEARESYRLATDVSNGNPYPLLNEVKLSFHLEPEFHLDDRRRHYLKQAERGLLLQVKDSPPYNPPWCFFDLSEINLLQNNPDAFLRYLQAGIDSCQAKWQAGTHKESLSLYLPASQKLPGLAQGIEVLTKAEDYLP